MGGGLRAGLTNREFGIRPAAITPRKAVVPVGRQIQGPLDNLAGQLDARNGGLAATLDTLGMYHIPSLFSLPPSFMKFLSPDGLLVRSTCYDTWFQRHGLSAWSRLST